MTQFVTNPILRERAKDTVHRNLGRLIVMQLILTAVTLAAALLPFLLFMDTVKTAIVNLKFAMISSYVGDELEALQPLIVPALLSGLMMLLISPLTMGRTKAYIDMARGLTPSYCTLFCRFRNLPGCIGLALWLTLKIFLWALTGIGAFLLTALLGIMFQSELLISVAPLVCMGCMCAFVIPASLRYYMADFFYADDPSIGVFAAVNESKRVMQYRKWQLFKLTLAFALIDGLITYAIDVVTQALDASASTAAAIGSFLLSLVSLAVTVYIGFRSFMSDTHFYDAYRS